MVNPSTPKNANYLATFRRARLRGGLGISPAAKPITRNLPSQAIALKAGSLKDPPTGS